MGKNIGIKKPLIISISSLVVVGAVVTSVIFISRNNAAQHSNENENRDNIDPLAPISNGVKLIVSGDKVTEYYVGDAFVAPVIFAKFDNGSLLNVSNSDKLTISGYEMNKIGLQVVDIEYKDGDIYGKLSYKIYVINAYPVSFSAYYLDTDILWGEPLSSEKIIATIKYSNNKEKRINDYILDYNYMPDDYGPNKATLEYKDFSTSFYVNVVSKEIDEEFTILENEMKHLLSIIGYVNPSCPKDYTFNKDTQGKGVFKNKGILEVLQDKNNDERLDYLQNNLFSGYTFVEGPTDSYEALFLSDKYVFEKDSGNITSTIYFFKNVDLVRYQLVVR